MLCAEEQEWVECKAGLLLFAIKCVEGIKGKGKFVVPCIDSASFDTVLGRLATCQHGQSKFQDCLLIE